MTRLHAVIRAVGISILAVAPAPTHASAVDWATFSLGGRGNVGVYFGSGTNAVSTDAITQDASGSVYVVTTKASGGNAIITTKYSADGQRDWQRLFSADGRGKLIALGADGDIVVAGVTTQSGPSDQFQLVKYDGQTGQLLWERRIAGTTANADPVALKIDQNNDVLLAGQQAAGSELLLFKVDGSAGTVAWSQRYDIPSNGDDQVVGMHLTVGGDVILIGDPGIAIRYTGLDGQLIWARQLPDQAALVSTQIDATGHLYVIGDASLSPNLRAAKIDVNSGEFVWQATFDPDLGREAARESAIDSQGNLVVVGNSEGGAAFVTKLAGASGQVAWTRRPLLPKFAYGVVAVDASDRPYVAFGQNDSVVLQRLDPANGLTTWETVEAGFGQLFGGLALRPYGADGLLWAYNPIDYQTDGRLKLALKTINVVDGATHWTAADGELDELAESAACEPVDYGNRAVLDSEGNTYVIGCSQAHDRQVTVSRFEANGRLQWRSILALAAVAKDPCCIRLLPPDSLLIGAGANDAIAAIRVSRQTGVAIWTRTYEFPAASGQSESMIDMEVDGAGNALLTGGAHLIKIAGGNGATIWTSGAWADPYIADLALDPLGDVYTTGSVATATNGRDLLVSKRSGADGQLLWEQDFDGVGRDEIAVAIATDDLPRIYTLAMSMNSGFRNDFLTLQLNPQSGAEVWRRSLSFGTNRARADALVIDGVGGVIVAGARFAGPTQITTIGYKSSGDVNFTNQISSGFTESDRVRDLVVVDGDVHLVGALQPLGHSNPDFFHASINILTGLGTDPLAVDFGGNGRDWATDILPLPSGKLRVVGQAHTPTGKRMVATEIDPATLHRNGFETSN